MSRAVPKFDEVIAKNLINKIENLNLELSDKPDLINRNLSIGIEVINNDTQSTNKNFNNASKNNLTEINCKNDIYVSPGSFVHNNRDIEGLVISIKHIIMKKLEKLQNYENLKHYSIYIWQHQLIPDKILSVIQKEFLELNSNSNYEKTFEKIYLLSGLNNFDIIDKDIKKIKLETIEIQKILNESDKELKAIENNK